MLRMSLLIEKTAAKRHSDIFLRVIHNICKIKLTLTLKSPIDGGALINGGGIGKIHKI